jgi:hypothetical protein
MTRSLAITFGIFAAILGLCLFRYSPPAPLDTRAPADRFSAGRAREVQRAISADGKSRSVGTEANLRARTYLEKELVNSGWKTKIQSATSCSRHGACARIANVVAVREGREPEAGAVLLMAHYDSVPCSPGASDDGGGTAAVVEAARAIGAGPPLRRTVVVVLTDGEEAGLLGAEAFVRSHPLAKKIHGAVNVDSRGSRGASAMFETSAGNAWIVGLLAKHAERPVTSSLFYEIYRRMPNDTDFTAVKEHVHGVNFANIARVAHYHTPLDSLDNADLGTLQHHGDQALAMVRALADAGDALDAAPDRAKDAVWFDVLATFIVRWPTAASRGLARAALALVVGWAIRMRAWGVGLAAPLFALLAAAAASIAVGFVLRAVGAIPVPWVAYPLPALIALHGTSIAAGLALARLLARNANAQTLWAGTWLTWGAIGVATAVFVPGACFLFVVPTLIAGFVAWLRIDLAATLPAAVAAVLWLPIALLVYDGLGLAVPALGCITSTLLVTTLPALDGPWPRRTVIAATGSIAIAVLGAAVVPKYSVSDPQRVNVVFRQDELLDGTTPPAQVYVEAAWAYMPWGKPPEGMVRALGAGGAAVAIASPTPWSAPVPFATTPRIALPSPTAYVRSYVEIDGGFNVRMDVRFDSPRGARTIAIVLPMDRQIEVVVEGTLAIPRNGTLVLRAVTDEGVWVQMTATGTKRIPLTILDVAPGLPPVGVAPLAGSVHDARDESHAVQTQEGDVTILARHVEL